MSSGNSYNHLTPFQRIPLFLTAMQIHPDNDLLKKGTLRSVSRIGPHLARPSPGAAQRGPSPCPQPGAAQRGPSPRPQPGAAQRGPSPR